MINALAVGYFIIGLVSVLSSVILRRTALPSA